MLSVHLDSHQASCPGHISPVRFLLRSTKIVGNKDGKPIKDGGGRIKNCLERILYVITCVFANYCINNTFNKANWNPEDNSA